MTTVLLEQLAAEAATEQDKRRQDLDRYHTILRRANAPKRDDVSILRGIMGRLDIDQARVEGDLRILDEARQLAAEAGLLGEYRARREELAVAKAEADGAMETARKAAEKAASAWHGAGNDLRRPADAADRLRVMKERHPELLAGAIDAEAAAADGTAAPDAFE